MGRTFLRTNFIRLRKKLEITFNINDLFTSILYLLIYFQIYLILTKTN
jgi:hypothetical protein